jgi:hypothetical protein
MELGDDVDGYRFVIERRIQKRNDAPADELVSLVLFPFPSDELGKGQVRMLVDRDSMLSAGEFYLWPSPQ